MKIRLLSILSLLCFCSVLQAHKASDSYLYLNNQVNPIRMRWDIAVRDLELVLGLDSNRDQQITWGEIKAQANAINAYAASRLSLAADQQPCQPEINRHLISEHNAEAYLVLDIGYDCVPAVVTMTLDYHLLFDRDPLHRGLVRLDSGQQSQTWVFGPDSRKQHITIQNPDKWRLLLSFIESGIHHILIGYDHLLFLMALLLPSVLVCHARHWRPVESFKPALIEVVKLVTAFTLAHSITLSLAIFKIIVIPAQMIEFLIALSVLLTALNNLYPVIKHQRWLLAFGFGLLHGFGFANVMLELDLPAINLSLALLGFNLGVELGQLAIVVLFFPLAYGLRKSRFYLWGVFYFGSFFITGMALYWIQQRIIAA